MKTLEERMKEYEKQSRSTLLRRTPVIIRLDGKAFHTFTKGFEKPYDVTIDNAMHHTMKRLCESVQGCVFGYTQSDEITLVLKDWENYETCAWFDNQVQKMCSVVASMCTAYFNEELYITSVVEDLDHHLLDLLHKKRNKAFFDARVFNVPPTEVVNCLLWRQQDCIRNSIQGLAQKYFTQKELDGCSQEEMKDMLDFIDRPWEKMVDYDKYGSCCYKVEGIWSIDLHIPLFKEDRDFIERWLD